MEGYEANNKAIAATLDILSLGKPTYAEVRGNHAYLVHPVTFTDTQNGKAASYKLHGDDAAENDEWLGFYGHRMRVGHELARYSTESHFVTDGSGWNPLMTVRPWADRSPIRDKWSQRTAARCSHGPKRQSRFGEGWGAARTDR
jgi:hypothetical protein